MYHSSKEKITTTTRALIAIAAALGLLAVVIVDNRTTFVYAQTTTNTTTTPEEEELTTTTSIPIQVVEPPSAAQQIINNTQAECEQAQFLPTTCVILVYESPTTVVLNGDVAIFGGSAENRRHHQNSFLWEAVDDFKAQGYTITAIEMSGGAGNQGSSNRFSVIMSK